MGREQPSSHDPVPTQIGDAAAASSAETAAAIDKAAAINDDPQVAQALDEAALAADTTVSRVSWIQRFLHRLRPRSG
jgi:hypothetical protein